MHLLHNAVVGAMPPAPAVAPEPASPIGLSRSARGLKQQLTTPYATGGLGQLQAIQASIASRLQNLQPSIIAQLRALNATINVTTGIVLENLVQAVLPQSRQARKSG